LRREGNKRLVSRWPPSIAVIIEVVSAEKGWDLKRMNILTTKAQRHKAEPRNTRKGLVFIRNSGNQEWAGEGWTTKYSKDTKEVNGAF
jgi:hypothetical protein